MQGIKFNPNVLQAPRACTTRYLKTAFPALRSFLSTRTSCISFCLCKTIKITTLTQLLSEYTRKNSHLCPQSPRGHYRVAPSRTQLLLLVNTGSYCHHKQQRGNPMAQLTQHTLYADCFLSLQCKLAATSSQTKTWAEWCWSCWDRHWVSSKTEQSP